MNKLEKLKILAEQVEKTAPAPWTSKGCRGNKTKAVFNFQGSHIANIMRGRGDRYAMLYAEYISEANPEMVSNLINALKTCDRVLLNLKHMPHHSISEEMFQIEEALESIGRIYDYRGCD